MALGKWRFVIVSKDKRSTRREEEDESREWGVGENKKREMVLQLKIHTADRVIKMSLND